MREARRTARPVIGRGAKAGATSPSTREHRQDQKNHRKRTEAEYRSNKNSLALHSAPTSLVEPQKESVASAMQGGAVSTSGLPGVAGAWFCGNSMRAARVASGELSRRVVQMRSERAR